MSYVRQGPLLLYCMMLCGCVIYPNYPSSWASLESAQQDCFLIGGVYHNKGDGGRYGVPHLTQRLFRDEFGWPVKDRDLIDFVDSVEVAVTKEGALEVTARSRDRSVKKKQLFANKEEYRCNDGKIEIVQSVVDSTGPRRQSVILSKSIDGALVVQDGALGLGLFVIPIADFEWQRYKPYQSGKPESQPMLHDFDRFVHCRFPPEKQLTKSSHSSTPRVTQFR